MANQFYQLPHQKPYTTSGTYAPRVLPKKPSFLQRATPYLDQAAHYGPELYSFYRLHQLGKNPGGLSNALERLQSGAQQGVDTLSSAPSNIINAARQGYSDMKSGVSNHFNNQQPNDGSDPNSVEMQNLRPSINANPLTAPKMADQRIPGIDAMDSDVPNYFNFPKSNAQAPTPSDEYLAEQQNAVNANRQIGEENYQKYSNAGIDDVAEFKKGGIVKKAAGGIVGDIEHWADKLVPGLEGLAPGFGAARSAAEGFGATSEARPAARQNSYGPSSAPILRAGGYTRPEAGEVEGGQGEVEKDDSTSLPENNTPENPKGYLDQVSALREYLESQNVQKFQAGGFVNNLPKNLSPLSSLGGPITNTVPGMGKYLSSLQSQGSNSDAAPHDETLPIEDTQHITHSYTPLTNRPQEPKAPSTGDSILNAAESSLPLVLQGEILRKSVSPNGQQAATPDVVNKTSPTTTSPTTTNTTPFEGDADMASDYAEGEGEYEARTAGDDAADGAGDAVAEGVGEGALEGAGEELLPLIALKEGGIINSENINEGNTMKNNNDELLQLLSEKEGMEGNPEAQGLGDALSQLGQQGEMPKDRILEGMMLPEEEAPQGMMPEGEMEEAPGQENAMSQLLEQMKESGDQMMGYMDKEGKESTDAYLDPKHIREMDGMLKENEGNEELEQLMQQLDPEHLQTMAQIMSKMGEGEDKILAHINPKEAKLLAQMSGYTMNELTGLPQFGKKDKEESSSFLEKMLAMLLSGAGGFITGGIPGAALDAIGSFASDSLKDKIGKDKPTDLEKADWAKRNKRFKMLSKFATGLAPVATHFFNSSQAKEKADKEAYEKSPEAAASKRKRYEKLMRETPEELQERALYEKNKHDTIDRTIGNSNKLSSNTLYRDENSPQEYQKTGQAFNYHPDPKKKDLPKFKDGGMHEMQGMGEFLEGLTGGQDDSVPAMLSDGEYVLSSDVVSHLGDGNSSAGAKKLDAFVKKLRSQKTSKKDSLPPKSLKIEAYIRGK